jgi:S-layer protein (TIGR01567 family)
MPVFGQTIGTKSCEIRGQVAGDVNGMSNLADDSFTWNPQNFAGFFYDIKKDLGTESIKVILTGGYKLSGDDPRGIIYTASAQNKAFERGLWGSYKVIGFLGERYFAGYNEGASEEEGENIFFKESTDKNSLSSEQLQKILIDSKDEIIVKRDTPLRLAEGYELDIKAIDTSGMYLELTKNGQVIDSKVISPSKLDANALDKTYWYKNPAVGDQKNLVTIGVLFMNAKNIQNQTFATVDGIWQISETPTEVKADTQYGKMTITSVDANAGIITMENKDNAITLSKNKDTEIMPGINLRTADNDTLRFYIYSEKNCQCG